MTAPHVPIGIVDVEEPSLDVTLPPLTDYRTQPDDVRVSIYRVAGRLLQTVKAAMAAIETQHAPGIQQANALHKSRIATKQTALGRYPERERELKLLLLQYEHHEAAMQRMEQRRRAEIARREDEEKRLAEAEALEADGLLDAATALLDAPAAAPIIEAPRAVPRLEGITTAVTWRAEVVDMRRLCRAIADGEVTVEAVLPNMVVLNAAARAGRETFRWPGCRAVATQSVRSTK